MQIEIDTKILETMLGHRFGDHNRVPDDLPRV